MLTSSQSLSPFTASIVRSEKSHARFFFFFFFISQNFPTAPTQTAIVLFTAAFPHLQSVQSEPNTSSYFRSSLVQPSLGHHSRWGGTSVTLRNASDGKKLISSAGSQPPSAVWRLKPMGSPAGWRLWKQSDTMTQQSWVRVTWHFAAI